MNIAIEFNKRMFKYFCKHNKELMNDGFTHPKKLVLKRKKIIKSKENLNPRFSLSYIKLNKIVNIIEKKQSSNHNSSYDCPQLSTC